MSYEDMLAAARETATGNPFAAMLREQPGVQRSRQAFITGARALVNAFHHHNSWECAKSGN